MSEAEEDPAPTTPDFQVTLLGFPDAPGAKEFGQFIGDAIRFLSRYIRLSRLDGVTVAFDYDRALADLDRGYERTRVLTRINDDAVIGVAMAPAVLRGGSVKAHLVFHAPYILPLLDSNTNEAAQALYLIAHECAHVEELELRDTRFPGTILQRRYENEDEQFFEPIVASLWEEYAACRISAVFGKEQVDVYEQTFTTTLADSHDAAVGAITAFRLHGDVGELLQRAGSALVRPLLSASYLLGHLDGRGAEWDAAPDARDLLKESSYSPLIERLSETLRQLWSTAPTWESEQVFQPLKQIARDALEDGGIFITLLDDGRIYVEVPFN